MNINQTRDRLVVSRAVLAGSEFDDADLSDARLARVAMKHASVTHSDLHGSSFESTDMTATAFNKVNLRGAVFEDCCLEEVTIDGIKLSDMMEFYSKGHGASSI